MSIVAKIKQFLPGSSRSLHAMHEEVSDMHNETRVDIDNLNLKLDDLYRRIEQADNGINMNLNYKYGLLDSNLRSLSSDLDAHDTHMKMFAWDNYRIGEESIEDAKKRFFRSLPTATGGMRLLQLGCAKLLNEFDALCHANDIQYWINFGTLIGAVRHSGFVPWDDDTDLGIMRDDLCRLVKVVADAPRYKITLVYDRYVYCRQVRFWYADDSIPCFLDLFIYDWASSSNVNIAKRQQELRRKMVDEMSDDKKLLFWQECPYYSGDKSNLIQSYYDHYIAVSREEGIICNKEDAQAIIWSIDNMDDDAQRQWTYSLEDLFPSKKMKFEGAMLEAPANPDVFLWSSYGDIFELPKDIHSHFEHVNHDGLESGKVNEAMKKLLEE